MGEPRGCSPQSLLCAKGYGRYFGMCYIIYSLKLSVRQALPRCIDEKPGTEDWELAQGPVKFKMGTTCVVTPS